MSEQRQVVVLGSGPAGLTAAIYTARANLKPLVLEGEPSSTSDQPGGQLMLTTEIENFPGFVEGIEGPELMARMRDQAKRFGADFHTRKATRVDLSAPPFKIWTGEASGTAPDVVATSLIIATGAQSLMLGVPGESRLLGHGLSTCATCDGFFFREQDVAVVGGGDSAIEEALFLTRFVRSVTIVHRRAELRASKIMQERAFSNEKISFRWNSVVTELLGESKLTGVALHDLSTAEDSILEVSGVFVAIGHAPSTAVFNGQLELRENGYIQTYGGTRTSVEGVFACGDVQDDTYRQAITAAGSGCSAAIDLERWLDVQEHS
ncbi:MAG: thioredoxin-disulfide reductase [Acidimicrobiales bacterium]